MMPIAGLEENFVGIVTLDFFSGLNRQDFFAELVDDLLFKITWDSRNI